LGRRKNIPGNKIPERYQPANKDNSAMTAFLQRSHNFLAESQKQNVPAAMCEDNFD
jgi:hypothetical protein